LLHALQPLHSYVLLRRESFSQKPVVKSQKPVKQSESTKQAVGSKSGAAEQPCCVVSEFAGHEASRIAAIVSARGPMSAADGIREGFNGWNRFDVSWASR
jgi:hypothetical protein